MIKNDKNLITSSNFKRNDYTKEEILHIEIEKKSNK